MKKLHINVLEPPQEQLDILLKYYQTGGYVEAEKLSLSITQEFPKHQFAWKVLAAVYKQNGRINESLIITKKSLQLNPQDTGAHFNLSVLLQALGRLEEAEASYRKAIELKPDYTDAYYNLSVLLLAQGKLEEAQSKCKHALALKPDFTKAHNNLGVVLQALGKLEDAEVSYRKAIELKPDYDGAHNNLGVMLQKYGKSIEACSAFIQAINLNPDFTDAYANLSIAIKDVRFNSSNVKLYPLLTKLLTTRNFAQRPADLAFSILSLLKHDPLIKNLLLEENFVTSLKEVISIIGSIDKLTLLHNLMRVCPLPDLQFERFFKNMRSLILTNLDNINTSPELIYFLSTLSLHCFTNEYVYIEEDEETELVENLAIEIAQTIVKSE